MNSMNIDQIHKRIEEMLIYYAYKKDEESGQLGRDYETKFFTLRQLQEDIMFNRSLPSPYKKVIYQVLIDNNNKHAEEYVE